MAKRQVVKGCDKPEVFQTFLGLSSKLLNFLSTWIHVSYGDLVVAQQLFQNGKAYHEVQIPKNRKEKRILYVPAEEIKLIQRHILDHILSFIPLHFSAYGCRSGVSFVTGARKLTGFAHCLYSIDLRHAFPSVTRRRVEANINKPVCFQLAQFGIPFSMDETKQLVDSLLDLMVYQDSIPQGAPTSPALLNICCRKLDREITHFLYQLSESTGVIHRYIRYVDDISIGSEIPDGLNEENRKKIRQIVKDAGFHVHPDKEKYVAQLGKREVAEVTGVRIHLDGKLTLDKKVLNGYRTKLNAMINRAKAGDKSSQLNGEIHGLIGYIHQVYGEKLPSSLAKVAQEAREVFLAKN